MVNGKKRDDFEVSQEHDENAIKKLVHDRPKVQQWISGKKIVKELYIKGKIYTLVVKD
jgi:leucyl-tRNA synthetase